MKKDNNNQKVNNNKKSKKIIKKQEPNQISVNLDEMSLYKKLYILRECIDFLALGIKVDQKIIDRCYEDILVALGDYEYLQTEFEGQLDTLRENMNNLEAEMDTDNYGTPITTVGTEDLVRKIYKELYDELLEGLDILNEKYGTIYEVYFYPNVSTQTCKLKIWNMQNGENKLKRVYDDYYDLKINLQQDINTNFSAPKISIGSNMKLSPNKKDNVE